MSLNRRNPRRDASELQIVKALECTGWTVTRLSIPDGPDLLAGRANQTELIECKTGAKKLRANQSAWAENWRGRPVRVMRSFSDVVALNALLHEKDPASMATWPLNRDPLLPHLCPDMGPTPRRVCAICRWLRRMAKGR